MKNNHRPKLDDLFHDLYHPNPNINRNAYKNMHSFWPNESKYRLLKNLNNKDVNIRRNSVKALSYFGKTVINSVVDLYLSTQERVLKISCLKVLIKIAANNNLDEYSDSLDKVIESALYDYSVEMTLGLINLLRQIGKESVQTLIELTKDKETYITSIAN